MTSQPCFFRRTGGVVARVPVLRAAPTFAFRTLALAAVAVTVACATGQPGAAKDGNAQIALWRGRSWATYAVKLPAIWGSTAQLRLEGQKLHGFVEKSSLHLQILPDAASGFGPSGPIDIAIRQQGADLVIDGRWNGGPVHLTVGPTRVEGSLIRWGANVGRPAMCGYKLDHLDDDGTLFGMSTCEGLPERTALEIDARVRQMLKPSELAVVIITILASPPSIISLG